MCADNILFLTSAYWLLGSFKQKWQLRTAHWVHIRPCTWQSRLILCSLHAELGMVLRWHAWNSSVPLTRHTGPEKHTMGCTMQYGHTRAQVNQVQTTNTAEQH